MGSHMEICKVMDFSKKDHTYTHTHCEAVFPGL